MQPETKRSFYQDVYFQKIEKEVEKELEDDIKKSRADPIPKLEELSTDVYFKPAKKTVRGVNTFMPLEHKNVGKSIVPDLKIK